MNAAESPPLLRSVRGWLVLALLAAAGIALGWFIAPRHARTFTWVYTLVEPSCVAVLCASSLHHQVKHSRWLVPLLIIGVVTNVAWRPHDTLFAAVGVAAGGLAILAALFGRTRTAIAATLLCCSAVTATLLAGLLGHGA